MNFDKWVSTVLDETSNYYVVAWRPENEEEKRRVSEREDHGCGKTGADGARAEGLC